MGFDECTKTHIHYYSITWGSFTALEILCGEQNKSLLVHEGRRGTCGGDTGKSHKFDGWIGVRDGLEDGQRVKGWIGVPHL